MIDLERYVLNTHWSLCSWIKNGPGLFPDVPRGQKRTFWCAIRGVKGGLYYRALDYLNAHVMPLSDTCCDVPKGAVLAEGEDDLYVWTGWHEVACDQCETQWEIDGDRIVAWMPLPKLEEGRQ